MYFVKDILISLVSPVSGAKEKATKLQERVYLLALSTFAFYLLEIATLSSKIFFQVTEHYSPFRKDFLFTMYFFSFLLSSMLIEY